MADQGAAKSKYKMAITPRRIKLRLCLAHWSELHGSLGDAGNEGLGDQEGVTLCSLCVIDI